MNKKSPLYSFSYFVLFSLHLLYEDMKLNHLKKRFLADLVKILHRVASDLKLSEYVHHYWMDFPNKCSFSQSNLMGKPLFEIANYPPSFAKTPPNIYLHLYNMLQKKKVDPFPYIFKINNRTRDLIQVHEFNPYF